MFCKCLLQTDKSGFNYSSRPTQFSLCCLENTEVFCFSQKKNSKACFLGWQESIFSFKILITNFDGLLKKNRNVDLKRERITKAEDHDESPGRHVSSLLRPSPSSPEPLAHLLSDSGHFETRIYIRLMPLHG